MMMQLHNDVDVQAGRIEAEDLPASPRRPKRSRKVTVRLSEELYERFSSATTRPGLGKSMVVEAALERFLNPAPSVEDFVQERFDDMAARFDRLDHDIRMMAETLALHARYHLSVMPPMPQSRQQDAALLGDERFMVLAEQVDRRVRLGRPLMHETIDRLSARPAEGPSANAKDVAPSNARQNLTAADVAVDPASSAAAGEGGSKSYFRRLPN
jgi:predicted DNA-binding protein